MRLIAVDPGTDTGYAIFTDGVLTHAGLGLPDILADAVIIERPEYRKGSRVSPNDLIELAIKVGITARSFHGAKVTMVKPSQWKGSVPKAVHHPRVLAKLEEHELAVVGAVRCAGSKLHNVIDAIGLGLVALQRMGRGA